MPIWARISPLRKATTDAEVVITGRVADPSLFLGVAMGITTAGATTICRSSRPVPSAGHLLECSVQVTGGCFGRSRKKDVPDSPTCSIRSPMSARRQRRRLASRWARVARVDRMTCTEQDLFTKGKFTGDPTRATSRSTASSKNLRGELRPPASVRKKKKGNNRVSVYARRPDPRHRIFKVVIGYADGYIGAGEIAYAGITRSRGAARRGDRTAALPQRRGGIASELQVDLIGISSLHGDPGGRAEFH